MKLTFLSHALVVASLGTVTLTAQAADFTFSGNVAFNTDVVNITFDLASASTNVDVWSSSWQSGLNFDPTAAVWARSGNGYTLLGEVDDDDTVGAGQGAFDAGLHFASLAAGQYLVTLAASPNYANGSVLAAGFRLDGSVPIRIADWTQPGSNPNFPDQKGTFWQVNLSNVSQAAVIVPVVPEPSTWLLMALGLAACGAGAARSRRG